MTTHDPEAQRRRYEQARITMLDRQAELDRMLGEAFERGAESIRELTAQLEGARAGRDSAYEQLRRAEDSLLDGVLQARQIPGNNSGSDSMPS